MEVNIILEESAFIVEAEGKTLRVSYKEECLPYKEAHKFCEENGGGDEMPSTLNISLMNGEWCVQYADFLGTDFEFCNTELIDALYDMVVKLKEKGVI